MENPRGPLIFAQSLAKSLHSIVEKANSTAKSVNGKSYEDTSMAASITVDTLKIIEAIENPS
jgi:hypothetical protein